ncbi:unnamed protein product, partial [Candidula unifasciata]
LLLTVPKEVYYDVDLVVCSVTLLSSHTIVQLHYFLVTLLYSYTLLSSCPVTLLSNSRCVSVHSVSLVQQVLVCPRLLSTDGSQVYRVKFTWEHMHELDETGVVIAMSCGEYESKKTLTFSQNFGYIFIQTDKPVYTPLQTVMFRVIAVDEHQKLAKYMIRIDIRNHKHIVVDRLILTAEEAFTAKKFPLPKETPPGQWFISAHFERVMSGATVTFEVKEYVLPRFSSIVRVDPDVITQGTEWITVNVTTRYVYGRPVFGLVELKLGVYKPTGLTMLPVNFTEPVNCWISNLTGKLMTRI